MPTYYVRTDGSDANAGTSSGTGGAWQTIGKALGASGISSGDTVYIAPGTYREVVTVAMTSATAETIVAGDPTAAQFSGVTPGRVVLTAYTTNDDTTPSGSSTLNLSGRDYLTFRKLKIVGGSNSNGSCVSMWTQTSSHIKFSDCIFADGTWQQVAYQCNFGDTVDLTFERCTFRGKNGGFNSLFPSGTGSEYDIQLVFHSCVFAGHGTTYSINIAGNAAGANFAAGGVVTNCTFNNCYIGVRAANYSVTTPCAVKNSHFIAANFGVQAGVSGQLTEDYNRFSTIATPRTNVTAGTNSLVGASQDDFGDGVVFGLDDVFFMWPIEGLNLDGAGTATGAPSTDLFGNSFANPPAVGAIEVGDAFPAAAGGGLIVHPGMTGGMRG